MTTPPPPPRGVPSAQPPEPEPSGPVTPGYGQPVERPGEFRPSAPVPADAAVADPTSAAAGTSPTRPAPGFDERGRVKNTRTSGVWVGIISTAVFLILLIIFIAQNSRPVSLHFLGWHGRFSLALTILLSAVIGILVVAIPGTVRILQLRRALRKNGPGRD